MISISNVTKRFGTVAAVDNISVEIQEGSIFGLVGPDGAGKTTVIRLVTGILDADAGTIRFSGSPDIETAKSDIGYVPQKFSLYGDLTVMENIQVIGALYGQADTQIRKLSEEILGFTGLLSFKDRLADNLSGGMKQKLALAAGLMHKPRLFILDEPTTGVDPVSRREFWRMLYRLNKEGMTILVSTPYMDEAEFCTQVAFMNQGQITACASPAELRNAYPHQVLELATPQRGIRQHIQDLILDMNAFGSTFHLIVDNAADRAPIIAERLSAVGTPVTALQQIHPTLEDVFVALSEGVNQ